MTIFELLALGIQRGISPITALLAPRLPANILLTASGPAVIYTQIMEVCRESGWGVTTDRSAGVVGFPRGWRVVLCGDEGGGVRVGGGDSRGADCGEGVGNYREENRHRERWREI